MALLDLLKGKKPITITSDMRNAMSTPSQLFSQPLFIDTLKEVPGKLKILTAGRGMQGLFRDQPAPETFGSAFKEGAKKLSFIGSPEKTMEAALNFGPGALASVQRKIAPKVFGGFKDITLDTLEKLKGRSTVSKQFIEDLANRAELRQAERDLIRNVLKDMEPSVDKNVSSGLGSSKNLVDWQKSNINVQQFANKVKTELLPLKRTVAGTGYGRYENISLPKESRGPVSGYQEHVYKSPIETSAGETHFAGMGADKYFAHSRIEDLPPMTLNASKLGAKTDKIRRVIELQSDLFQKGRLEGEKIPFTSEKYTGQMKTYLQKNVAIREAEISKLEPYRNTWHERIIREEVKQAAKDSKTKLQFPTGETAMKIEGLGETASFYRGVNTNLPPIKPDELKVGMEVYERGNHEFIITDVLGDGKFKAAPKALYYRNLERIKGGFLTKKQAEESISFFEETFDISGKVDTSNPIYRFYEKEVGRFLTNKFGAKLITDPQGVKWWELNIGKELKDIPVLAHGKATIGSLLGGAAASAGVASLFVPSEKLSYEKQSVTAFGHTNIATLLKLQGSWQGTNYDPMDRKQNRPFAKSKTLGIGSAGVKMDESMVAVPRKKDGITGMLRLGTVIYIPQLNEKFLVADLKAERYNGQQHIDFATIGTSSEISQKHNQSFKDIIILREGEGREDVREYVESGEWEKEKNKSYGQTTE